MVAPWEEPLVQRATELGLGVRIPDDIEFLTSWGGDSRQEAAFSETANELAALIGIDLANPIRRETFIKTGQS
jgi:hypothetical protein